MKILRVLTETLGKDAEKFIFEALKPGGFEDSGMAIPVLKDRLAWTSWSNLIREEQPTYAAIENGKIVGVVIGEPIETTFDLGEAEIQDVIILPEFKSEELVEKLMQPVIEYYRKNGAKQTHVWCLKSKFDSKDLNMKCKVATEKFGFEYKGFSRISKWTAKETVKLELYF